MKPGVIALCGPVLGLTMAVSALGETPAEWTKQTARYHVLPGAPREKPAFNVVELSRPEQIGGFGAAWELTVRTDEDAEQPLMQLRAVTSPEPWLPDRGPLTFFHYQLRIPETGETLEYRNVNARRPANALLPMWADFAYHFVPRPATATDFEQGMPRTCEYLGHVLTLRSVETGGTWEHWDDVRVLELNPELLIGTGRSFKDREGARLPQTPERQNYNYVQFTGEDYRVMIEAGFNLFTVRPEQEQFVRSEPVFYLRGAGGDPALRYPADLYRSNYVGATMFMDEPTVIMIGDPLVHTTLRYFTDAAALITRRTRARYLQSGSYGAFVLEQQLKNQGFALGDMRIAQLDYPSWETVYQTAYYQLVGGLAGIVHEGRYQLDEFNEQARASTGLDREHTAEEMLRYHYAFLRGAARRFGKDWGTSIYGQADPALSPLAVRMAYDMGARYLWYWTSDHDHHLPWPEQIELTEIIRDHAAAHPRASIDLPDHTSLCAANACATGERVPGAAIHLTERPQPTLDKLILIPYGYFLTLESDTGRRRDWDLWWVREMDAAGQNEASQRFRRLMRNALIEVHKALDAGEDFDIGIDDGHEPKGYREVVRVTTD